MKAARRLRLAIAEGVAQGAAWQFHYLTGAAATAAIGYKTVGTLEFLLDERLEFERGGLKQGKRLLQLRCQHQRLRQALR